MTELTKTRKIKWENLKREAVIPLWDAGFTEEEIANVLGITVTNVIRFKEEYGIKKEEAGQ